MKKISLDFIHRIDTVDWSQYKTAYGGAEVVPEQLKQLVCGESKVAMNATHELWCGLCHQHAYISSAALPAFPFLLEVLKTADDEIAVEILDIFLGFAECSNSREYKLSETKWELKLRSLLVEQSPLFLKFAKSQDEIVADFAQGVIIKLSEPSD